MTDCYYCHVPGDVCWTCRDRSPEAVEAMNDWLRFYVQEILAGRVCASTNSSYSDGYFHRPLANVVNEDSISCPCNLFESRSDAHSLLSQVRELARVPYHVLLIPPRDLLLKEAGLTSTPDVTVSPTPTSRSKSERIRARALSLAVGSDDPCTWDRCPICLINGRQQASGAVRAPSPIDISRLGWGVEMETYLPDRLFRSSCDYCSHDCRECGNSRDCYHRDRCTRDGTHIPVGNYHHGLLIQTPGAPDGWTAERDGSLETDKHDYDGVEIVSPVLRGVQGLKSVQQMSAFLQPYEPYQNHKSGLHVHVSVGDASAYELHLMRFLFARVELAFYASCGGLASRRFMSSYCRPSTRWIGWGPTSERYCTLNMCNALFNHNDNSDGHAEIRIWPGTTKYNTIAMAVHMAAALVGATHDHWLPPDDAPLDTVPGATGIMCNLIERYPVANTTDTQIAIATLGRRSRSCDLSIPAVRTYIRDKEAVLP